MKNVENSEFWKSQLVKQFELNDIGKKLLDFLEIENPEFTYKYIKSEFSKFYREEIIEMFNEDFAEEEINKILKQLNHKKLDKYEIITYEIKVEDDEEEL